MKDNEAIRTHMHRLLDVVLDGNGFEARSRARTGTLPTIFFNINAHINEVDVQLFRDGWQSGGWDKSWSFKLNDITGAVIDDIEANIKTALETGKEIDVLRRDIARQEAKVQDEKDKLSLMKRTLRGKERREKASDGDAD